MSRSWVEELSTDPHPALRELRGVSPVARIDELGAWMVTSHGLCMDVMRDFETYTVDDPRFSTQQVIGPSMLSLDGGEHRRHRDPFLPPFGAARIREIEDRAREQARRLVAAIHEHGSADLRAMLAAPLALNMMSDLLDLDGVRPEDILGWYHDIVEAVEMVTVGGEVPEAGARAFTALGAAVGSSTEGSRLLAPIAGDGSLTAGEIVSNVAVLLFGGIVTTESSMAIAFRYLFDDPDLRRRLESNHSLVPRFVEETLRLEPSATVVDRYATRDVLIAGSAIGRGDLVRVSLSAANRDPDVFPAPDEIDLTRANLRQSLTFARGPHACLGIHLARLETRVAVEAVLDALTGWEAGSLDPIEGLVFRAPATVRVSKA